MREKELLFLGMEIKISDPSNKKSEAYKLKINREAMKFEQV
jgi:hypothetical protein